MRVHIFTLGWIVAFLTICLLALTQGCSSVEQHLNAPPQLQPGAAAPIELGPPSQYLRSVSERRQGDFLYGGEYDGALPQANVSAPTDGPATFSPGGTSETTGLAGTAYAVYPFSLAAAPNESKIYLEWADQVPQQGELWVGLGNFSSNSWTWQAGTQLSEYPFDPAEHYSSGAMLVALVFLGDTAYDLKHVKLGNGGITEPVAILSSLNQRVTPGALVNFDASASYDLDGTIDDIEWDFDGNGIFNEAPDESAARASYTASFIYAEHGKYMASVRLTDDGGATGSAELEIIVTFQGDWSMFGRDAQHNRRSPFVGPQTNNLKWTYTTGGAVKSSPALAADGTIYVGSDDNKLHAVTDTGTTGDEKWTFEVLNNIYSSPAVGPDGTIYAGSHDWRIYAFQDDGDSGWARWGAPTLGAIYSSPTIGDDGTIYIGSDSHYLFAYTDNGPNFTEKWTFGPVTFLESTPAVGLDGRLYFGGYDTKFYSITDDQSMAEEHWAFETGGGVYASAAIGSDGTIYMASEDKNLYALTDDGHEYTIKWSVELPDALRASPAIGADGTIYQGCWNGTLYAVTDDGTSGGAKWNFPTGGALISSPAIGGDGTIYFGSTNGKFYAVTDNGISGTELWSYQAGGEIWSSPAIGENGTVYVGSNDNKLYAFADPVALP